MNQMFAYKQQLEIPPDDKLMKARNM
jgi:hypothetical protein